MPEATAPKTSKSDLLAGAEQRAKRKTWKTKVSGARRNALLAVTIEGSNPLSDAVDSWMRRANLWNALETLKEVWERYKKEFPDWMKSQSPLRGLPQQEPKERLLNDRPKLVEELPSILDPSNSHFVVIRGPSWLTSEIPS